MIARDMSLMQAFNYVKSKRPQIMPNWYFTQALMDFENKISCSGDVEQQRELDHHRATIICGTTKAPTVKRGDHRDKILLVLSNVPRKKQQCCVS